MNNVSKLLQAAVLSGLLASCASRTMDSIPTLADLNAYEQVVHARYQVMYDELEKKLASGAISKADYAEEKRRLDSKVAESVNDAAWNKHYLAESERKSDGVPTPDQPVALGFASSVGGGFYMPSYQNYGAVTGMGGSAGMGSMRSANEQIGQSKSIRNDAMSSGGTYLSAPPPGSVYDQGPRR
jgi:hypothetical protein